MLFGSTLRLCGCCKQQRKDLLEVATVFPSGGILAMSVCVLCRHTHWKRSGFFLQALPVYEQTSRCPVCP